MSEAEKPAETTTAAAPEAQSTETKTPSETKTAESDAKAPETTPLADAQTKAPDGKEPAKEPEKKEPDAPKPIELKLPEGSHLDASRVEAISAYAKEKGLTQEAAQAVLERESAAIDDVVNLNTKTWMNELKADKEFGGQDLKANGELALTVAEKYFGPEFVGILKSAHLNNHPALFRGLVRIGKASASDSFVHPGSQGDGPRSDAELFYPSKTKE